MDKKLLNSSKIALADCMGLKKDESLLIISDEVKKEIGTALFEVGKKLCKEAVYVEMKSREINGQEPPPPIAEMMKQFDVVICPTAKSLTHTNARREAVKLGVRVGTMPGISKQTMVRCLSADYDRIVKMTNLLTEILRDASEIRVTSKLGTDIIMPMKGRKVIPSTGVLKNKGDSGNLPSGEVYLAPWEEKSNGKVIIDGSMAGIGLLKKPIIIEVINGYAEKITGGTEAKKLVKMLDKAGRDARAVAEFGIGTNYKAKIIGQILEDEKVMGTIHIAFGNNVSMGGNITVSSHLDGLVRKPNVFVDGAAIMDQGKLLID